MNGWSHARRRLVVAAVAAATLLALGPARAGPLSDEESRALLAALEGPSASAAREAIDRILEAGDRRFVAVFVEILRASETGVAAPGVRDPAARALGNLRAFPATTASISARRGCCCARTS